MERIEIPSNFNKDNFDHVATIKAENTNGDIYYSDSKPEYNIKDVPLREGLYKGDDYLYRVNDVYSEFVIYVFSPRT